MASKLCQILPSGYIYVYNLEASILQVERERSAATAADAAADNDDHDVIQCVKYYFFDFWGTILITVY